MDSLKQSITATRFRHISTAQTPAGYLGAVGQKSRFTVRSGDFNFI